MTQDSAGRQAGGATLSTWDTVSVIVGIVIGAGIYETPPLVFSNVSSGGWALLAWAVGGLLCLNGAFTYAELASTYPRSGGDYVYLSRAFGSWLGFLFGWAQISVILTGSIGMMAYVFANYAATLWDFGPLTTISYAMGGVVVLTLTNLLGVALGKHVQNALSSAKLLGLAAVILVGLLATGVSTAPVDDVTAPENSSKLIASFASALVLVFLTYGGWNDAAFFVAEMRDRRKIIRALSLGILVIAVVYILINAAYLRVLGWPGVRDAGAIASDMMQAAVGPQGARGVAVLVAISALSSVNGIIFAGSRLFAVMGEDHRLFALLARRNQRFGSPAWALVIQGAVTLVMIAVVGTDGGQAALNHLFNNVGLPEVSWAGKSGFDTLLRCTAPVFWLFFLLTSVALFVLRQRDPKIERPFRAPLYPLCPALFAMTCGYMLYGAIHYAESLAWVGVAILAVGMPVYAASCILTARSATVR